MAIHTIELFAGVSMLGEGLRAALGYLGIQTRTVCYVEREAYAAAVLAARIQEGSLDAAPVWSDVTTFDAKRWAGAVDCVAAGFPCQDLSFAGQRAGLDGARSGLFFEVLRIARDCGAEWLVLENVSGIASATAAAVDEAEGALEERAAARVVGELADLGWDAEWITLSASDVGASHGRERWFCLAKMADPHGRGGRIRGRAERTRGAKVESAGHALVNSDNVRAYRSRGGAEKIWRGEPAQSDCSLANTSQPGFQNTQQPDAKRPWRRSKRGAVAELCGAPLFAPGPANPVWPGIIQQQPHLAPALEPGFRRVADGLAHRMDDCRAQRLKCCGNGVVAAQAAAAFVELAERLMTWR